VSNYPLSYKLSWLPRFLRPTLKGSAGDFARPSSVVLAAPERTVRLAFVGDISAVANARAPVVDPSISSLLRSTDLVVGNCESPVVERTRTRLGTRLGTHHAMSERFLAEALAAAGIQRSRLALSLANNHALDQGAEGFGETRAALRRLGIRAVGLAQEPVTRLAVGPLEIGLAAFTLWRNGSEADFFGKVAMALDPAGLPGLRGGADLLCVLPHWDWEFRHFPQAESRTLARQFAERGVGLIVGGHARVVQPVETIGGATVAYGLGDLLGTAFARQPWPGRIGAILVVDVSADAVSRGAVAGYRLRFFYRMRDGDRERLLPVESLEGALRHRVTKRLVAIYGTLP
jgi:poly-gamma-glutamate synthesis protein (capsule biosynthesis protein)